jgi:hypothetical protein
LGKVYPKSPINKQVRRINDTDFWLVRTRAYNMKVRRNIIEQVYDIDSKSTTIKPPFPKCKFFAPQGCKNYPKSANCV